MAMVKITPSRWWKTVSQRQFPNHFLSVSPLWLTMFAKLEMAPSVTEGVTFRHACHEEAVGRLMDARERKQRRVRVPTDVRAKNWLHIAHSTPF